MINKEKEMKKKFEDNACPLQNTLDIIGGKWKMVILHFLKDGEPRRFKELERIIGQISPRMLIKELKDLEAHKIVHREQYPTIPPTVEYSITDFGKTLMPIIQEMENWGNEHFTKLLEEVE